MYCRSRLREVLLRIALRRWTRIVTAPPLVNAAPAPMSRCNADVLKSFPGRSFSGKKTRLRALLRNVANKSYWLSTIGGFLTHGDPRPVWLSMTTDF